MMNLIFDFDGTLLDTEMPELIAWQEIYKAHGVTLELSNWAKGIGTIGGFDPYAHLETLTGQPLDRASLRRLRRKRFLELMAQADLQPGTRECLALARRLGLKIGLASSSSHQWVEGYLGQFGVLDYFEVIRCADDVAKVKPDPELYLSALAGLGLKASEALVIEDSPNGIAAAKSAGIYCVAVPNPVTAYLDLSQADLQLTSLWEVRDLIERQSFSG